MYGIRCGYMIKRILLSVFLLQLAVLLFVPSLYAQTPGENLTLKISVNGPGGQLWSYWGHIALVIENKRTGDNRFYDYGLFSFRNTDFFYNFAFGRLWFSCGDSPAESNIANYISINRGVKIYTLDVPPENRVKVRNFVEDNVLPENSEYFYHHFWDNCSTRIRDIIDLATDGQFKEKYGEAPGRFTLRQHVRRHTWFNPPADWFLNFLMGQDIDKPLTVWDEMFLPSEVGKRIAEFMYTGPDGVSHPLVTDVEVVYQAVGRSEVRETPRMQWPRQLAFGIAIALLLGFFYFLQTKSRVGYILVGMSHSIIGLFFGIVSLALYFMSLFTDHDYTYHNMNMIFASPLLLAAVPLGIKYAFPPFLKAREQADFLLRLLWMLVVLGIFVSMLLKLLPWFWQANLVDQMLMLPIALVFAFEPLGFRELLGRVFWRWF